MRSGSLRTKVEVQEKSSKRDEYRAKIDEWNKVYSAKGNVRYLSGSELIKAGVDTNIVVVTVKMRSDDRMKESLFLFLDGERFEVSTIKPSDRKREIIVTATRETN
jgi:SPP1 family predicted phage head-tail adaptor